MTEMTNTTWLWALVAFAAAAIIIAAAIAATRHSRVRTAELRRRFGPEYDRALQELGSRQRAERELSSRAKRVRQIHLSDLSEADRARFASNWSHIQEQFVDDPASATVAANELIKEVMSARGYPSHNFEERIADLSVDHAAVIQHYRAARALSETHGNEQINTEDLRQALVHFRALFADLLQPSTVSRRLREEPMQEMRA